MRKDMCKLFSEEVKRDACPVANARARYFQRTPLDELPQRESMTTPWRGFFNEGCWNSKPLKGYLAANVGRQWNEVFSEICRHTSLDNYVQQQMRDALLSFVQRNIEYDGEEPRTADGLPIFAGEFWVDPRSGNLCQMPADGARPRYRRSPRHRQVSIDAQRKYVEIKGAWFVVRFEPFEAGSSPFDAVLSTKHERSEIERGRYAKTPKKKHVPDYFYTGQWGAAIYAVEKRQISGAEIRKLKRAGVLPV